MVLVEGHIYLTWSEVRKQGHLPCTPRSMSVHRIAKKEVDILVFLGISAIFSLMDLSWGSDHRRICVGYMVGDMHILYLTMRRVCAPHHR